MTDAGHDKLTILRKRAEEMLRTLAVEPVLENGNDLKQLLHELSVYQIELEMQNEELSKSRHALEFSLNKYQQLYDFAPLGYFTLDPDGVILEVNLAGASMLGVERNHLGRKPFIAYLAAESQPVFYRHRRIVLDDRTPHTCELVLVARSGARVHVSMHSQAMASSGHGLVCLSAVTDMSGRIAAEQGLKESETRFRQLVENLREVFWIRDVRTDKMLYVSSAFPEIWGRPASMAYADPALFLNAIHPDDRERVRSAMVQLGRTGEKLSERFRVVRPDGGMRWAWARAFPVRDESGAIYRVVGLAEDVTETRKLEDDLRRAMEAAERASMTKSEFLANMSHEIRTPMNAIVGMTGLLLEGALTGEQRELLMDVESASQSLLAIINDILDFSKIEAGKVDLKVETFDLWTTVNATVRTLAVSAERKGLELTLTIDPSTPRMIQTDPGRLRQVLVNLVGNAIKFTPSGCVAVRVWRGPGTISDENGACFATVNISVEDTGIGIHEDKLGVIFDTFTQGDLTTTKSYGGTGLGLAICKRLVDLMGGSILAESILGRGSRFSFSILAELMAGEIQRSTAPEQPDPIICLKPLAILLAEDNELNQRFAVRFLGSRGHTVRAVSNGQQVLEALASETFDLVLMDVSMPVMDGIEATVAVRAHDGSAFDPTIPIVAVTAHAVKGDRERFLQAGMNAYLSKPLDLDDFERTVLEVTCERTGQPRSRPAEEDLSSDEPFDIPMQEQRFAGMQEFLPELLDLFKKNAPACVEKIQSAMASEDLREASKGAHTLKGMAAVVCAMGVSRTAARMEEAARDGRFAASRELLTVLETKLNRALAELDGSKDGTAQ